MIRAVLAATLLVFPTLATPVRAGGSIGLDDVLTDVAASTPALVAEIEAAVKTAGVSAADVVCVAEIRLGNRWTELGGTRIVPIECVIGGRTLTITGTVTFRDAKGRALKPENPKTFEAAVAVEQTDLKWTWK